VWQLDYDGVDDGSVGGQVEPREKNDVVKTGVGFG
jgi:hypothetical protein